MVTHDITLVNKHRKRTIALEAGHIVADMNEEGISNMIRRFFRHIREGFYGVGRHAAMSVSSASAVTITLLIISIFMIVTGNMQEVTHNIEGSVKISAFVAYDHENKHSWT